MTEQIMQINQDNWTGRSGHIHVLENDRFYIEELDVQVGLRPVQYDQPLLRKMGMEVYKATAAGYESSTVDVIHWTDDACWQATHGDVSRYGDSAQEAVAKVLFNII